jgi:DNA polymerase
MRRIFIDTETLNDDPKTQDLPVVRETRYAEKAKVILLQYSVDDADTVLVERDEKGNIISPPELHTLEDDMVIIHNANFDEKMLKVPNVQPAIKPKQIFDTARWSAFLLHKASLDMVCKHYDAPEDIAKKKSGKALINIFCYDEEVHQKLHQGDPKLKEQWASFREYADYDIRALKFVYERLRKEMEVLSLECRDFEDKVMKITSKINAAGIGIDNATASEIASEVGRRKNEIIAKYSYNLNSHVQFKEQFKQNHDIELPACDKETLSEYWQFPEVSDRLILGSKAIPLYTSLSRFNVSYDTLRYAEALTGRWSSAGFQNMPRPKADYNDVLKFLKDKEFRDSLNARQFFDLAQSSVRALIVPKKATHKLLISDFNAIERRVMAHLAGDTKRLKEFELFDKGQGVDTYRAAAMAMLNLPAKDITPELRDMSKVMCLSLAYGVGIPKFVSERRKHDSVMSLEAFMALSKNIRPSAAVEGKLEFYKDLLIKKKQWSKMLTLLGGEEVFTEVGKAIYTFREEHEDIFNLGKMLLKKYEITYFSMKPVKVNDITLHAQPDPVKPGFKIMNIILPSKRSLILRGITHTTYIEEGKVKFFFYHEDQPFKPLNGGTLLNYVTQGFSRDLMAAALLQLDAYGFEIVNTIHDEFILEVPKDYNSSLIKEIVLGETPYEWYNEVPKNISIAESQRYYKF